MRVASAAWAEKKLARPGSVLTAIAVVRVVPLNTLRYQSAATRSVTSALW